MTCNVGPNVLSGYRLERSTGRMAVAPRTIGTATALLAVIGLFGYSQFVRDPGDPVLFGWSLGPLNWLWLLSFVGLGYGIWPLAANPPQAIRYLRRLSRNYLASAAGLYLLAFFLVGTFGPLVLTPRHRTSSMATCRRWDLPCTRRSPMAVSTWWVTLAGGRFSSHLGRLSVARASSHTSSMERGL